MDRIDGPTATAGRKFTEGNPGSGIPATVVSALYMNSSQEEICNAIEETGEALNVSDEKQLVQTNPYWAKSQNLLTGAFVNNNFSQATFTDPAEQQKISASWKIDAPTNVTTFEVALNPIEGALEFRGTATAGQTITISNFDIENGSNGVPIANGFSLFGHKFDLKKSFITGCFNVKNEGSVNIDAALSGEVDATGNAVFHESNISDLVAGSDSQAVRIIEQGVRDVAGDADYFSGFTITITIKQSGSFAFSLHSMGKFQGRILNPDGYYQQDQSLARISTYRQNQIIEREFPVYDSRTEGAGGAEIYGVHFPFLTRITNSTPDITVEILSVFTTDGGSGAWGTTDHKNDFSLQGSSVTDSGSFLEFVNTTLSGTPIRIKLKITAVS